MTAARVHHVARRCGGRVAGTARAQQTDRVRRIGVLMGVANDAEGEARVGASGQGFQQFRRWRSGGGPQRPGRYGGGGGDPARLKNQAAEVAAMMPDVILAGGAGGARTNAAGNRLASQSCFVGSAIHAVELRGEPTAARRQHDRVHYYFQVSLVGKMWRR